MTVTQVGPEAAGRLAGLHARAFDTPWSEGEFHDLLSGAGVAAFTLDEGFILIRTLAPEAEILALAVAPEARRQGLGRALVSAAAAAAAGAGAEVLFLEVAADNRSALALYRAMGFAPVGVRRGYYPRGHVAAADALTLRLTLNSAAPNL